ncbi:MAG: energy transducer TonB [Flavobacteriales bacterium]|nr:energy transducer TonB [Flavobacteriales bacterium]
MFTTLLILVFLLITALLATRTGWNDVLSPARNELVFAGRNQDYGAYKLRQEQPRTMVIALFAGLAFVGTLAFLPTQFKNTVVEVPKVPEVNIDDVIFELGKSDPVKPKDPDPVRPDNKPSAPVLGSGILVAKDSVATTPKDTTSTDPGPKPDPDPGGGGKPGPGPVVSGGSGKGTETGTSTKETWELEALPEYPGGEPAMHRYLSRTVHYPEIDVTAGNEGRVTVGFIVRADGSVSDVKVLKGVSPTIDAEAVRVVKAMGKWKPGKFNKREVDVRYALPIVFKLAKN